MKGFYYYVACFAHKIVKHLIRHQREPLGLRFVDFSAEDVAEDGTVALEVLPCSGFLPDVDGRVEIKNLYPVENAVPLNSNPHLRTSFELGAVHECSSIHDAFSNTLWRNFIDTAEIPNGYRNAGLRYAGYIKSGRNSWCLPSWIWTNAAIVRYLCSTEDFKEAIRIGDVLLALQGDQGGWVVRSDFALDHEVPVLAPNDSAYIANNALLVLYERTSEEKYLRAAMKCADWIIRTARSDGLVWTGYNQTTGELLKKHTIVDTGFTAGLFAKLYLLTGDDRYGAFLEKFVDRFIELFFSKRSGCFATSINIQNNKYGGSFTRGQAWALEGLIPAYCLLKTGDLKDVIQANVDALLRKQLKNGGWAYNLDKPYYGEDCKGIPVIARALLDWNEIHQDERLLVSAKQAILWCERHTSLAGRSLGGIFSFNLEGAVVHNFYTETAFVYSSVYALEVDRMLKSNG